MIEVKNQISFNFDKMCYSARPYLAGKNQVNITTS